MVWHTEFGRPPISQSVDGRDHNPYGFSICGQGAEQRRLLKTREKASPKGCSGDQVAALDKIEIMLLSQLGLHSRQ